MEELKTINEIQNIPSKKIYLKELVHFTRGKNITSSEMIDGPYPVVSAGLSYSGFHNDYSVKGPSISVSSSGANAGIVLYHNYSFWAADCNYADYSSNMIFAYYFLRYLQPVITNRQMGAAQPHVYAKDLNKLKVEIPLEDDQKKISSILNKYDQLIENNNKRIKILEDMAQELYKEWFCRNLDGKNHNTITLGSIISNEREKLDDWTGLRIIDLANMPSFSPNITNFAKPEEFNTNIYTLKKYDLLFGSIRPYLGKRGFSPIEGAVAGTVLSFNVIRDELYSFVYCLITSNNFIDYMNCIASGTKMPTIKFKDLQKYKINNFYEEKIFDFNKIVRPMIEQMSKLMELNFILIEKRDALLPRLMSGKLEV